MRSRSLEEDPLEFPFGGWQAPLMNDVTGSRILAAYEGTDARRLKPPGPGRAPSHGA